jgi:hypothetical protein
MGIIEVTSSRTNTALLYRTKRSAARGYRRWGCADTTSMNKRGCEAQHAHGSDHRASHDVMKWQREAAWGEAALAQARGRTPREAAAACQNGQKGRGRRW